MWHKLILIYIDIPVSVAYMYILVSGIVYSHDSWWYNKTSDEGTFLWHIYFIWIYIFLSSLQVVYIGPNILMYVCVIVSPSKMYSGGTI